MSVVLPTHHFFQFSLLFPPIKYLIMANIDYLAMGDTSNKALRLTDEEASEYNHCAKIIGTNVQAYMMTEGYTEEFRHDHIPVMLFGDDKGEFLQELTRKQMSAHSEGLSVKGLLHGIWKTLVSTPEPPDVLIAFKARSQWTPQETVAAISHFQKWVVQYNLLLEAYNFIEDDTRVATARGHYLEEDTIPDTGLAFFLSDHNVPLLRGFVAQNIQEHLDIYGQWGRYWTEDFRLNDVLF